MAWREFAPLLVVVGILYFFDDYVSVLLSIFTCRVRLVSVQSFAAEFLKLGHFLVVELESKFVQVRVCFDLEPGQKLILV